MESAISDRIIPQAVGSAAKVRAAIFALGLVLGIAVPLLLNATVPPLTLKNDMAAFPASVDQGFLDPLELVYGFYDPETNTDGVSYRWTGPHATMTFPYAGSLGRYAHITMRVAANRAPGQAPADVKLNLNGKPYAGFSVSGGFEVYSATLDTREVPNPNLDPAHVQLDIQSSTVTNQGDPRQLGVVVDWVRIQPERGRAEVAIEALVWAIALALVLLVAVARLPVLWSATYGLGALVSFVLIHLTAMPRAIPVSVEIGLAGLAWLLAARLAPRERPAWGLALAACGLWLVVAGRLLGDWQMDDAYISYRYAWNFAHGHGLVYNPGEPAVEGYTNFLWTILAAGATWVGLPPAGVTLAANVALALGILALTWYLSARLAGRAYLWPVLASIFLSVDVALLSYGARGSGMEAAALAFLVVLAVALLWGDHGKWPALWRVLGGLSLALASLTRPEGLLVAALLLGVKAWQDWRESSTRQAGRMFLAAVLPYLAIIVPYQVWRITFYGWLFPNTFYAKTGATSALIERGLSHLSFFWGDHWLVAALAVVGLLFTIRKAQRRGAHSALAALVLGYTLYIVWVGGDYFPGWRFFVPILAPIVLLAQEGVRIGLSSPRSRTARLSAAVVMALVAALYLKDTIWLEEANGWLAQQTKLHSAYINRWGSAGLWLRDNTPPQTWTVAKGAGAIAYYSQRPVIDIFGLNDLHIGHLQVANIGEGKAGHEKQDPQYVLDRHPDYILAEWDTNFQPVEAQLKRDYDYLIARGPIGKEIEWWKLK